MTKIGGFVAAFVVGTLAQRWLNSGATVTHPVEPLGQVFGFVALQLVIAATYALVRYGIKDPQTRLIGSLAVVIFVGVLVRSQTTVVFSAVAAVAILVLGAVQAAGLRRILALAAMLLISVAGFVPIGLFAAAFIRCDPKNRWLCETQGAALFALMVLIMCVALTYSKKKFTDAGAPPLFFRRAS